MASEVTLFYKSTCPYSQMAKELIKEQFGGHKVESVCVDGDLQEFKSTLTEFCRKPITTFPQVFIDDQHIGGYSDLQSYLNNKPNKTRHRLFFLPDWLKAGMGNTVKYFYKKECPVSKAVVQLVEKNFQDCNLEAISVDESQCYRRSLEKVVGTTIQNFPQVFINNKHIGSYRELKRLLDGGIPP